MAGIDVSAVGMSEGGGDGLSWGVNSAVGGGDVGDESLVLGEIVLFYGPGPRISGQWSWQ